MDTIQWLHRNHRQEVIYTETLDHTDPNWYITGATIGGPYQSGAFSGGGSDQFPGQKVDDETGLKDFGAWYYNSTSMRWTSADSVTAHIYDPQSLNKYTYVRNDPVNRVDPDGNQDCASTPFEYNGTIIGTYGDILDSGSNEALLAETMFTESGHGSFANYEEFYVGATVMNRWQLVNNYWYLSKSPGGPSVTNLGFGKKGDSIANILGAPGQFAVWDEDSDGSISLADDAQSRLDAALSSSWDSKDCSDLGLAIGYAMDQWGSSP